MIKYDFRAISRWIFGLSSDRPSRLTSNEKLVMLALVECASCLRITLENNLLVVMTGLSERTVRRAISSLVRNGYLKIKSIRRYREFEICLPANQIDRIKPATLTGEPATLTGNDVKPKRRTRHSVRSKMGTILHFPIADKEP